MSLQRIKKEIFELHDVLDSEKYPPDPKTRASWEIRRRKQVEKLEKLEQFLIQEFKNKANLYLVAGLDEKESVATAEKLLGSNRFVSDHLIVARKLANFLYPSIKPGNTLSAFQLMPANQILKELANEVGLHENSLPDLELNQKFLTAISSREKLVMVLEAMLESYIKNPELERGHDIQAMIAVKSVLDNFAKKTTVKDQNDVVIFVSDFEPLLLSTYAYHFGKNITKVALYSNFEGSDLFFENSVAFLNYLNEKDQAKLTAMVEDFSDKKKVKKKPTSP